MSGVARHERTPQRKRAGIIINTFVLKGIYFAVLNIFIANFNKKILLSKIIYSFENFFCNFATLTVRIIRYV